METILLTLLGTLIYFVMEFKSRATTEFDFSYWIKDNWINLLLIILVDIAYIMLIGEPTKEIAFVIGLVPNLAADWIGDLIKKYKS